MYASALPCTVLLHTSQLPVEKAFLARAEKATLTSTFFTFAVWDEVQSGAEEDSERLCDTDSCLGGDLALHCEMNPGDDGDTEEDEDSTDCGCALAIFMF
jgi:hypothetical protein